MTRRSDNPNQETMIVRGQWGDEQVKDLTSPIEQPGASVDLAERAAHLDAAFRALGEMSQRTGFQIAATTHHRQKLENRYGGSDDVDRVTEGTHNTREKAYKDLKWHFARAFGQFALSDAGVLTTEEAREFTRDNFAEFEKTYAESANRERRNADRKKFSRAHRIRTGQFGRRKKATT